MTIINRHAVEPVIGVATMLIGLWVVAMFSGAVAKPQASPATSRVTLTVARANPLLGRRSEVELGIPERDVLPGPSVIQSEIVSFRYHGKLRVETVEQLGKSPWLEITEVKSPRVLFHTSIENNDALVPWKTPNSPFTDLSQPFLRFGVVHTREFRGPLIMAVGVSPGGSDAGFYMTLVGEVHGKISRLLDIPASCSIEGGFYVGRLNNRFGFGLVTWDFIWGNNETHPEQHHYQVTVYKFNGEKFIKVRTVRSRHRYGVEHSQLAPLEIGIRAVDQRKGIRDVRDSD